MLYIRNLEQTLEKLRIEGEIEQETLRKLMKIIENVRAYLEDAKHYLNKGDYPTSLVCVAYGEGLIDALRELGYVKYRWERARALKLPTILVAGTFDLLHPGHLSILREAWKLGKVVVVVARDSNVQRFKGRPPIVPERQRLEVIKSVRWVDEAVLGDPEDILRSVERVRPDIILLGPDQRVDEEKLREELRRRGIDAKIIRLRKRSEEYPLSSTSSIIRRVLELFSKNRS